MMVNSEKSKVLQAWAKKLKMPDLCMRTALSYQPNDEKYMAYKTLFWNDIEKFFVKVNSQADSEFLFLAIYLRISYEFQYEDGSEMELVKNGFYLLACQDLVIWAEDAYRRHGHYGMADGHYDFVGRLLNTSIVRLGRLEFEKWKLYQPVEIAGMVFRKDSPVINVHIPASGPLCYEECEASYQLAASFFLDYFEKETPVFVCESWLLCPVLQELLPEDSHINRFRKDYKVFRTLDDRQLEERVFGGEILENPQMYPTDTSLQRMVRERLMQGEKLMSAEGIFVLLADYKDT
jgi:hypothetical protein